MGLNIYSGLTRQKEPFVPLVPGQVGMYVCGITPYDASHIGHARSALVFDVVARHLRHRGYRVTFVRNYTDVDDKIIARAGRLGIPIGELTERHIKAYQEEMARLGVEPPTTEPRATQHIPQMVALIERLVAAGVAYAVDGDVYFEVRRFSPYGRHSGKNLEELLVGARVEVDERKRDPRDFALWKAAKPGEPSWPSPWGPGRPGWHIECSAMAMHYLGETFDLHGGGEDLVFPHHECEIAQSEAATGKPFARYWLYNGFVKLGAEKMSKSLGNVLTIEGLLRRHDPEALRLYLLQTHYRNPVEFSEEGVEGMRRPLERFRTLVDESAALVPTTREPGSEFQGGVRMLRDRFEAAMDDDFNTPQAVGALNLLASTLSEERERVRTGARGGHDFVAGVGVLIELGRVLGLSMKGTEARLAQSFEPESRARIDTLVQARDEARRQRDWARADALRAELDALGVALEDTPGGTKWKRKIGAPTAP
ncbi:MAG TPA: cysteine--tRNA ligase [Methylomirabilota bacterium]|nr:cysteine--tRNA ligase [Methylomirabilota bacterium]